MARVGFGSRRQSTSSGLPSHQWARPPSGWVKVNSYASCSAGFHRTWIEVVIRDEFGQLCAAMTNVHQALYSPFNGEALAMFRWLQLALRLHFEFVEVESDCQSLILMLNNGSDTTLSEEGCMDSWYKRSGVAFQRSQISACQPQAQSSGSLAGWGKGYHRVFSLVEKVSMLVTIGYSNWF